MADEVHSNEQTKRPMPPRTKAVEDCLLEATRLFMLLPAEERAQQFPQFVGDMSYTLLCHAADLEGELAELPASWRKDSSLETWFPYTAEELERLRAENERFRSRRCKYAEDVGMAEHCCAGTAPLPELQATPSAIDINAAERAIREHNNDCDAACAAQRPNERESGGCGYQYHDGSLVYSRSRPNCPKEWKIDFQSAPIQTPVSERGQMLAVEVGPVPNKYMMYLLNGKPHRVCDCDPHKGPCKLGAERTLHTCELSRCIVPEGSSERPDASSPTERKPT